MSVNSPLGATRSGAFDLRAPGLDARAAPSQSRLGLVGLAGLMVTGLLLAISAASTADLLPQTARLAVGVTGLQGAFGNTGIDLGGIGLTVVVGVMFASYFLTVGTAGRLSPLLVLGVIAALNALMLLGPPLVSTDVFSYQFYGRIGDLYGFNPYLAGPHALYLDPLYPYIGSKWVGTPTVYGPLFTALSYLLAPLSILANVIAYKAIAAVSSLAVVALVWNGARLRGIDPVKAAALVGLNPLIIVYGVGGGHNDLLMLVPLVAGVVLLLQRRGRLGAASIVVGRGDQDDRRTAPAVRARRRAADHFSARVVVTSWSVPGWPRRCSASSRFALFGAGPLHLPANIEKIQSEGNWQSIPGFIGTRLGLGTVGHRRLALTLAALFVLVFAWLIWRVWRGQLDWIAGAGWAAFALLVSAARCCPGTSRG